MRLLESFNDMSEKLNSLSPIVRAILTKIVSGRVEGLWEEYSCHAHHGGIWVREDDLPEVDAQNLLESGLITDEQRIAALEGDGNPSVDEILLYQKWWIDLQLSRECDHDRIMSYVLAPVDDKDGHNGVALILRRGYSFSEIQTRLEDVFASNEEAINWMKEGGWCAGF